MEQHTVGLEMVSVKVEGRLTKPKGPENVSKNMMLRLSDSVGAHGVFVTHSDSHHLQCSRPVRERT